LLSGIDGCGFWLLIVQRWASGGSACGRHDGRLRLADGGFAEKPIAGSHGYRLEEDDGAPNPVVQRCAEDH
ncbi:hypothetical protein ACLOJK_027270, partial [Asimina triloba]